MCTFITINSTIRYLFPVYLSLIPHGIHSYTYLQLLAMHKHCILKQIGTMKITVHLLLIKRIIFHVTVLDLIEVADILLQMPRYVDNKLWAIYFASTMINEVTSGAWDIRWHTNFTNGRDSCSFISNLTGLSYHCYEVDYYRP